MPLTTHMTWEPSPRRWRKTYRGKTYTVSCRALGTPETKEGSAAEANSWWKAKKIEVDAGVAGSHPEAPRLRELARRVEWARSNGDEVAGKSLAAEIHMTREGIGERIDPYALLGQAFRMIFGQEPPAPAQLRDLFAIEALWEDRIDRGEPASEVPSRTLADLIGSYIEGERGRLESGEVLSGTFAGIRLHLLQFRDWLGATIGPTALPGGFDQARWDVWVGALRTSPLAPTTRNARLRVSRGFVETMMERGLIPGPINLRARRNRIRDRRPEAPIKVVEVADFRRALAAAPDQLAPMLLLMANAAFTQIDAAELLQKAIDWDAGVLTHKRVKTRRQGGVPTVRYRLWPETLEALKPYRTADPDARFFLTAEGRPLIQTRMTEDNRRLHVDLVRQRWVRRMRPLGFTWSLKLVRKTGASLLRSHPVHAQLRDYWLGLSAKGIADRHYAKAPEDLLDDAVAWLRTAYGFGS